jgi:hypothetical protein
LCEQVTRLSLIRGKLILPQTGDQGQRDPAIEQGPALPHLHGIPHRGEGFCCKAAIGEHFRHPPFMLTPGQAVAGLGQPPG